MRRLFMFFLTLAVLAPAQTAKPKGGTTTVAKPPIIVITPDKINWVDGPPSLPPGAKVAVLVGNPAAVGPFVIRLKFIDGYKVMPHRHPTLVSVTVVCVVSI